MFKVSLKQNNILWCILDGSFLFFFLGISGVVVEIDDDERSNVEEEDEQHDPVGISIGVLGASVSLLGGGTALSQLLRETIPLHVHWEQDHGQEDEGSWKMQIQILQEELQWCLCSDL